MKLLKKDPQPRICNYTWGLCAERSGHFAGPGSGVSNPHLCTDMVMPDDREHGHSKNTPHYCTACRDRTTR